MVDTLGERVAVSVALRIGSLSREIRDAIRDAVNECAAEEPRLSEKERCAIGIAADVIAPMVRDYASPQTQANIIGVVETLRALRSR